MALPSGAPAMRDHRILFVAALVSALTLQSSVEEGRDGALRWTGRTRAELYSVRDVGIWATAEVFGSGDERKRADRSGARDSWPGASVLGGGDAERLAVRAFEAARGRGCGGSGTRAEGSEGRSTGRLGAGERAAHGGRSRLGSTRLRGIWRACAMRYEPTGSPSPTWCVRRIASRRCFSHGV